MNNIPIEIVVDTLKRWIESCISDEQLLICRMAVHDLLWTRYADDNSAIQLKAMIDQKRSILIGE